MSYLNVDDTIVAQCTSEGKSSIDIVRISGPSLVELYKKITRSTANPKPNQILKKNIYAKKNLLDVCLVSYFKAPKSFTGDDLIEINCHGGDFIASNIIKNVCALYGVRVALPGEFSFRAYYNGKIDLLQAESINDIISSETNIYANKSLENIQGRLSEKFILIKKIISEVMVIMEHELDFSEEEITFTQKSAFIKKLKSVSAHLSEIKNSILYSKVIRGGLRVVLIGRPNAGKSSLFNAIVGYNRAIVSKHPGTTRDTVEALVEIDGHKVRIIDTAGYWESKNSIEKLGIKKTEEEIIKSDILMFLGQTRKDLGLIKKFDIKNKTIKILSKSDIHSCSGYDLSLSTKSGSGLDGLLTLLSTKIKAIFPEKSHKNNFLINQRQGYLVCRLESLSEKILDAVVSDLSYDIVASMLHDFLETLNELIHPISREDILNDIFSGFCIGK